MYKGMDSYCGLSCEECEYREEFHCGGCMATAAIRFMVPVSWQHVPAARRSISAESVRISAVKCFTVILMMTRREMIRKGQGSSAAVR